MKVILILLLFYLVHHQYAKEEQSQFDFHQENLGQVSSEQLSLSDQNEKLIGIKYQNKKEKERNTRKIGKWSYGNRNEKRKKKGIKKRRANKVKKIGKRFNTEEQRKLRRQAKAERKKLRMKGKQNMKRVFFNKKKNKKGKTEKINLNKKSKNKRKMKKKKNVVKIKKKTRQNKIKQMKEQLEKNAARHAGSQEDSNDKHIRHTFFGNEHSNYDSKKPAQEYTCDMYGYTRDFSTALTQVNMINRIINKPKQMNIYARTNFLDVIAALEEVTHIATTPSGESWRHCTGNDNLKNCKMVSMIYTNLMHCQSAVPTICNINTNIPNFSDAAAKQCKKKVTDYVAQYRKSIFGKNTAGTWDNYADVCTNLGSSWDTSTTTATEATPCDSGTNTCGTYEEDDRVGFHVKSPNTPLELWRDKCLPKTFADLNNDVVAAFDRCKDPEGVIVGSWGSCTRFLQVAVYWLDTCKQPSCNTGLDVDIITFYTTVYNQFLVLANINSNIQELCCYSISPSPSCPQPSCPVCDLTGSNLNYPPSSASDVGINCKATDKGRSRKTRNVHFSNQNPPTHLTGYTDIVAAMNTSTTGGTICNGKNISEEGKKIYNTLKKCSFSVSSVCRADHELQFVYERLNLPICLKMLKNFIREYQISNNIEEASKNQTPTVLDMEFMNTLVTGANVTKWMDEIKHDESLKNNTNKLMELVDKIEMNNCLDNHAMYLDSHIQERISMCTNAAVDGSYANCTAAKDAAIAYIATCNSYNFSDNTMTTVSSRKRKNQMKRK